MKAVIKGIIKELKLPILYSEGNVLITMEYGKAIVFKVYEKNMVMEYTRYKWVGVTRFNKDGFEEQIARKTFMFNEDTTLRGLMKDIKRSIDFDANPMDAGTALKELLKEGE